MLARNACGRVFRGARAAGCPVAPVRPGVPWRPCRRVFRGANDVSARCEGPTVRPAALLAPPSAVTPLLPHFFYLYVNHQPGASTEEELPGETRIHARCAARARCDRGTGVRALRGGCSGTRSASDRAALRSGLGARRLPGDVGHAERLIAQAGQRAGVCRGTERRRADCYRQLAQRRPATFDPGSGGARQLRRPHAYFRPSARGTADPVERQRRRHPSGVQHLSALPGSAFG